MKLTPPDKLKHDLHSVVARMIARAPMLKAEALGGQQVPTHEFIQLCNLFAVTGQYFLDVAKPQKLRKSIES